MRMRKRPNLEPRLDRCAELLAERPEELKGRWKTAFGNAERLYLELGCGKGRFTAETAEREPGVLLAALEKEPSAMVIAMERAMERGIKNLRFIDGDAAQLQEMFAHGEIDRLFINFCDPWPKSRDAKHRLTAPGFLRKYRALLPVGGQIHFKTDNAPLFDWSMEQFRQERWQLTEICRDLHAPGMPPAVLTDYEAKFMESGIKINRLVATCTAETLGPEAGELPRLRNAALSDARGFTVSTVTIGGEGVAK